MASSSLSHSACVEVKLQVSPEIMNHPLGFVIDAGGSLTKLVYRSKEDYKNCQQLQPSDHGILRLKSFTIEELSGLVDFLKANVDIALGEDHREVTWWHTGVTTQHLKTHLDKEFHIKTKLESEMMAMTKALKNHDLTRIHFHETGVESIAEAGRLTKSLLDMMSRMEDLGEESFEMEIKEEKDKPKVEESSSEDSKTIFPKLPADHYLTQLFETEDYKSWIDKYMKSTSCIKTPSLLLLVGSAGVISLLSDEFKLKFIDYTSASGKTLSGLAEEMLGEKDFDKFMKLAEGGTSRNVDYFTDDLRKEGHDEEDWYSSFCDDMVIFEMGKLSSNNVNGRGKHSKADLAAGLLSLQLHTLAKLLISCVRISQTFTVYVCGSMFQYPHVRKTFERHFYNDSMLTSIEYGQPFELKFFDTPGYLVSLGVWLKNVEEEKERQSLKPPSQV